MSIYFLQVFNREGEDGRFVSVTLKATDRGNPPLEGVCSFKVEITDVNDNPPLFHRSEYHENIKQDTDVGDNVLRVAATDEDADKNGVVIYSLYPSSREDDGYFEINEESGWIRLKKPLDVSIKMFSVSIVPINIEICFVSFEILSDFGMFYCVILLQLGCFCSIEHFL